MEQFDIVIDGARLEAARWPGSTAALPLLLLHEGVGSVALWRDFPARLAAATGRSVLAWSRRGYGWSAPRTAPNQPDYLHREASLLPAVLDACGLDRVHLFGHSDGGTIALLAAAADHDGRIASLTLEAPHVFVEDVTIASIEAARARRDALLPRLARYHADPAHAFAAWNDAWLDPRFRAWNVESDLPDVTAPTLLIQGVSDEYATMEQLDRIARGVRGNVRRLELDPCGHAPHREQEQAVLDATIAFLAEVESDAVLTSV
jgi:pimeloyl-ACP methyl ester carboxylesterase